MESLRKWCAEIVQRRKTAALCRVLSNAPAGNYRERPGGSAARIQRNQAPTWGSKCVPGAVVMPRNSFERGLVWQSSQDVWR